MEQPISLATPDGPVLEGRITVPSDPRGGLVLCHPHPLYGGDMDNPVITRAAEVAQGAGVGTLRFNFRGVGRSGGIHGEGPAEREDTRRAMASLAERFPPGLPLGLLGYSFGAWVATGVAMAGAPLSGLCLIAPPIALLDRDGLDGFPAAVLIVAGTRDPYCPIEELGRWTERVAGARTVIVDGADHFFFGKLFALGTAVEEWIRRWATGTLQASARDA